MTAQAIAMRARGLSYEQIARKLGIKRQQARYLIQSEDQEWLARRAAYSAANRAAITRATCARRKVVAAAFGSYGAYREARREAYAVAKRDGVSAEEVMQRWGILDVPGAAGAYLRNRA
jgi:orotate phosphoribosyltransferase-like protein